MKCPECHAAMEEGTIPTGGGMFWYRKRQPSGLNVFAKALPGTFAWFRRARLEAYHCARCRFVLFRYGQQVDENRLDARVESDVRL
jgi:hypothetical protein